MIHSRMLYSEYVNARVSSLSLSLAVELQLLQLNEISLALDENFVQKVSKMSFCFFD